MIINEFKAQILESLHQEKIYDVYSFLEQFCRLEKINYAWDESLLAFMPPFEQIISKNFYPDKVDFNNYYSVQVESESDILSKLYEYLHLYNFLKDNNFIYPIVNSQIKYCPAFSLDNVKYLKDIEHDIYIINRLLFDLYSFEFVPTPLLTEFIKSNYRTHVQIMENKKLLHSRILAWAAIAGIAVTTFFQTINQTKVLSSQLVQNNTRNDTTNVKITNKCDPCDSIKTKKDSTKESSENKDVFNGCPPEGKTEIERYKALNILKNRYNLPAQSDFDMKVTLDKLLQRGDDENRFSTDKAVNIQGYVFNVKSGGKETCNCNSTDKVFQDIHIELVPTENDEDPSDRVVVEVSPRLRDYTFNKLGISPTWNALKKYIKGQLVRVKGWLFYDKGHTNVAENTNPGNKSNWRGTAWEIHPITSIEIVK